MPSQGCAVRLMAFSSSVLDHPRVSTGWPFTPSGLVAHIIYRRKKTEEEKAKRDEDERSQRQRQSGKESRRTKEKEEGRKIERCFLELRRAYCVILATVAAATAGIIIISKGGQNTGPESHNAEFYDFWHRGDATGCTTRLFMLS